MISSGRATRLLVVTPTLVAGIVVSVHAQKTSAYFPPAGSWQRKSPAEVGMDSIKLQAAIDFARAHNSTWDFVDGPLTIRTIPGAGHFVQSERPAEVTKILKQWLDPPRR